MFLCGRNIYEPSARLRTSTSKIDEGEAMLLRSNRYETLIRSLGIAGWDMIHLMIITYLMSSLSLKLEAEPMSYILKGKPV